MINPAPGFGPNFGPLGPTAGPGSLGNGFGSKNNAGCTKNQPRRPIISPVRGASGAGRKKVNRYMIIMRPTKGSLSFPGRPPCVKMSP